jgi:hypothetical protein
MLQLGSSRGKGMLRGGGTRRPAHAGRLTRWERLAFAVLFLLMLAYIVAVIVLAIRSHSGGHANGAGAALPDRVHTGSTGR